MVHSLVWVGAAWALFDSRDMRLHMHYRYPSVHNLACLYALGSGESFSGGAYDLPIYLVESCVLPSEFFMAVPAYPGLPFRSEDMPSLMGSDPCTPDV